MHIINVRIHGSMTLKVSDILGERVIYFLLPSCLCTGCFLGHLCNQFILFLIPPWPSIPSSGDTYSREPPPPLYSHKIWSFLQSSFFLYWDGLFTCLSLLFNCKHFESREHPLSTVASLVSSTASDVLSDLP